jgi:glycosyltransferase involved in cell wall biosynthesis
MYPNRVNPHAGIFVHNQCKALRAVDVDIEVISPIPSFPFYPKWRPYRSLPHHTEYEGIPVTYLPTRMFPGGLFFSTYGENYAKALKPTIQNVRERFHFDLVHCHTLFPDGNAGVRLKKQLGTPVITTAHGSDVLLYPKRGEKIYQQTTEAIQQSDAVLTVSEKLAKEVRRMNAHACVKTIYNGYFPDRFSPGDSLVARKELGLPLDQKNLLFIGNLYPVKGLFYLLEAFAHCAKKSDKVHLHLVGEGHLRSQLEAEVEKRQLQDRVTFHGRQPYEKIPTWIRSADVMVLSSLSEGMPSILLESMGCGVPMIATDVGGIREILQHEKTGLLVPAKDVQALAAACERLLIDDPSLRRQYGKAAYEASYAYTWGQNAEHVLELYQQVINDFQAE